MPPALSGLIPTMGPDAAGGNWSRDLRPLPAGKKSLSKFGPTSPPKRLLLEKRRRARQRRRLLRRRSRRPRRRRLVLLTMLLLLLLR